MEGKDYFSGHSKLYAAFRPTYPDELYRFIFSHVRKFDTAWDCATGNGQVARKLAAHFKTVHATDISSQQLQHAVQADNIFYSQQPAEQTTFPDHSFDLITVAQALHWVDTERFYKEVARTLKPGGLFALWGYAACSINDQIDPHFYRFYNETVGPYWDPARKLVDNQYRGISFPFEEIYAPTFALTARWTAEEFAGYLTTWSATQKFIRANGYDPVPAAMEPILPYWKHKMPIVFPLFVRLARV